MLLHMKKLCKRSISIKSNDLDVLEKQATVSEKTSVAEDFSMAMAEAWDTQDLTVPWDWRKAHMQEIEARSKQGPSKNGP